jgi:hypothetical protein
MVDDRQRRREQEEGDRDSQPRPQATNSSSMPANLKIPSANRGPTGTSPVATMAASASKGPRTTAKAHRFRHERVSSTP